jgi:mRNA-degrading endonuclease RelE of RelBE toxin-antitoxin system
MSHDYTIKFHDEFFDDLEKLNKKELETVRKQIKKIKKNPLRFKRLRGRENCYSMFPETLSGS